MAFKYLTITFLACSYSSNIFSQIDRDRIAESILTSSIETGLGNRIIKDGLVQKSDSLKKEIEKLDAIITDFNQFAEAMQSDLIVKAGGIDPNYRGERPVLYKDKNVTNQFFITNGKGIELKNKIDATRQKILSFIEPNYLAELSKIIPLTSEETSVRKTEESWAERKFKNMPVAAILPVLPYYIIMANQSERVILDYWRLKNK